MASIHTPVNQSIALPADRSYFFSVRISNTWNQLSDETVNASSMLSFYDELVKTDLFIVCSYWKTLIFYIMLSLSINIFVNMFITLGDNFNCFK